MINHNPSGVAPDYGDQGTLELVGSLSLDEPVWILETKRLRIRQLGQGDFAALCTIMQDEITMRAYEGAFSDEMVQEWLDRQRRRYDEDGFGLWAVVLKEADEVIGQCGLTLQDYGGRLVIEVGYLFARTYWHQGFATEAAVACRDYAHHTVGVEHVYSIIRDTNDASIRVAGRMNMAAVDEMVKHYRGVEMPHIVYRMTW